MFHIVVKLGLALAEMIIGELFHQAQHIMKGAPGFAPGLAQRPQPSYINVRMTGGDDRHVEGEAGFLDAGA